MGGMFFLGRSQLELAHLDLECIPIPRHSALGRPGYFNPIGMIVSDEDLYVFGYDGVGASVVAILAQSCEEDSEGGCGEVWSILRLPLKLCQDCNIAVVKSARRSAAAT